MAMFDDYVIFDPGVYGPLSDVSRQEARRHFKHFVASLDDRVAELAALVAPAGIALDFSKRSMVELDEWFPGAVVAAGVENRWPEPEALSVCVDLGMYLGEFLRRRGPSLEWHLMTGAKTDSSYHRPVLTGFPKAPYPRLTVDFGMLFFHYAVRLSRGGTREEGMITKLMSHCQGLL